MGEWARAEGLPFPLGVEWIEQERAYNFALYSKHASSVELLLYTDDQLTEPALRRELHFLTHKSNRVWHCRIPAVELAGMRYYAYRIDGPPPQGRFEWHQFDGEKILLDPFARAVHFPPRFDRSAAARPGSNVGRAPLGMFRAAAEPFDWAEDVPPRHESDLIIYEMHVKGFTFNPNSGVSPEVRGTYAGVVEKIPYLRELGVTAVELMPIHQFDPQEENYWGYMTLNFFAPHQSFARDGELCAQQHEFKAMVKALHAAGIEVILDVVYNHTVEGNEAGPTYSYKGIDNSTYYMMSGDAASPYSNFSGTGNTMHCANRHVRQMILESLRYWVREMHVDGFRFDLASVFARNADGSLSVDDPPIFGQIAADEALAGARLICEPWDVATSQLGRTFPGLRWSQWNGEYRDTVRRFVKGDAGLVPALMTRLYGSDDLFPDDLLHAYRPVQSLNYVCSHDGFTLYDQVAYNERHNEANGHDNTDGPGENHSWNCGWEGDAGAPAGVLALRRRQVKNFVCLLLLANGTPMFRMGDEFLQTQGGNNNPYNQDNETSWLNWDRMASNEEIFRFFRGMIAFRKAHRSIGRSRFWRGDVSWYGVGPDVDMSFESRSLAYCLHGASQGDQDIYIMINAWWQPLRFTIQEGAAGQWKRVADTGRDSPDDLREPGEEASLDGLEYEVGPRSVTVLIRVG